MLRYEQLRGDPGGCGGRRVNMNSRAHWPVHASEQVTGCQWGQRSASSFPFLLEPRELPARVPHAISCAIFHTVKLSPQTVTGDGRIVTTQAEQV